MLRPAPLLLCFALACGVAPDPEPTPSPTPPAHDGDYLTQLRTPEQLASLAAEGGDVKYLAPREGAPPTPPVLDCMFQNMHRYAWHLEFLRIFEETAELDAAEYALRVVQPESRIWWGGSVRLWPSVEHPGTGELGVLSYFVYSDYQDPRLRVSDIAEVDARLKTCVPFAAELAVYLPDSPAQQAWARAELAALTAAGVAVVFPEDLVLGVDFIPWSPGEGYGTLRLVPDGQAPPEDLSPRDVLVSRSAPPELSLVAGLLTADPQNLHSHLNLRLREKGIPNATVPRIYDNALLRALDGGLVHVVVPEDPGGEVVIEPTTLAEAQAFWDGNRPTLPAPRADLSVRALAPLAALRHADAIAYGAKAANLGELTTILGAGDRPDGFAIPFARFAEHLEAAGIDELVDETLDDPRLLTDREHRRGALLDLRDAIRDAPLPPGLLDELAAAAADALGPGAATTFLRFRSSTNVEDLDELSGAGLHDSRRGCLADDLDGDGAGPSRCLSEAHRAWIEAEIARWTAELAADPTRTWIADLVAELAEDLTEERPASIALKKTWRSLWNDRAFEEREYYGIDHRAAWMGVAVHPAFLGEQADAVLVTNLPGGRAGPRVRAVSQVGGIGVVRPVDPGAVAEVMRFELVGGAAEAVELLVPSSHRPGGEPIWEGAALESLAAHAEAVHAHFAASVYPHLDPLRLDLEVKRTADDRVVVKQVRPYVAYEPGAEP